MFRAVTSASNVARRALCPGSERLETGLPDEDSVQSREGQLLHAYDANPKLDRAVLTPYQRDLLRISGECDEFIFSRVAEQYSLVDQPFEEGREKDLLALQGLVAETPGHCDKYRYWPTLKLLIVIDKKFGYKVVTPAAANYQLRVYALGGFEEWDVENCVVAITQPRLSYAERITMAAYTMVDRAAAVAELALIRHDARDPNAPLRAGEEQCRYCKAKALCPEYRRVIDAGLSVITIGDEPKTVANRQAQIERTLAGCSDQQLDKLLLACQFAGFIADPARDEARRRKTENPESLPEWTLGKASEIRKIADPARAIALLSLRGDLTREEVYDCSAPSISKIEEKIRTKKKVTWKEAKQITEDTLSPVIVRDEKRPTLTRTAKLLK